MSCLFVCLQLLDVLYREETLLNVLKCITKNAKSVLLTAVFMVILIYLFSICGFLFLQDDFLMEVDSDPTTNADRSKSLLMISTNQGTWILHFFVILLDYSNPTEFERDELACFGQTTM